MTKTTENFDGNTLDWFDRLLIFLSIPIGIAIGFSDINPGWMFFMGIAYGRLVRGRWQ